MIDVRPVRESTVPSAGALWCSTRYTDLGATVSKQHPLVAIIGQVGAIYVEIVAPRKNPEGAPRVTVEQDRLRRNQWIRDVRAKHGRTNRPRATP